MPSSVSAVTQSISSFLERVDKVAQFDASTPLFADGLGLDSLDTAELSALLEDEFGTEPFSADGPMPSTVGDILQFYADTAAAS